MVKRKWRKQNVIKDAIHNVRGTAYKEEELDSVWNEKQIKTPAITESKKKFKGTVETHKYIVVYWCKQRYTYITGCNVLDS